MVAIDDIKRLAELARISLTEEESASLAGDAEAILAYVSDVKEAAGTTDEASVAKVAVLREDGPAHPSGAFSEVLLSALPKRDGSHAVVRRIIGG